MASALKQYLAVVEVTVGRQSHRRWFFDNEDALYDFIRGNPDYRREVSRLGARPHVWDMFDPPFHRYYLKEL
jgi:hypothetical protein